MKKRFLTLYCTLDNACLANGEIMSRIFCSEFKQSQNKPNLYYRTVNHHNLGRVLINVSYYYYVDNTRKSYSDKVFDSLVKNTLDKKERDLKTKAFNDANGYTEEYFAQLCKDLESGYIKTS